MTEKEPAAKQQATKSTPAFPYSASINEPQTVSTPLPPDLKVPKPSVSSVDPNECTLGDENFDIYVSGENLFADSVIVFAGQDEPTTLNADGTLSTGINMAVWQGPDTVKVAVRNGPEISNEVDFTFREDEPATRRKGKR